MSDIDHLLFSDRSEFRAYGRLIATSAPDTILDWVVAEKESGSRPFEVVVGLVWLCAGMTGLVMGSVDSSQESIDDIVNLFGKFVQSKAKEAAKMGVSI